MKEVKEEAKEAKEEVNEAKEVWNIANGGGATLCRS